MWSKKVSAESSGLSAGSYVIEGHYGRGETRVLIGWSTAEACEVAAAAAAAAAGA
jgi:hypothetical protein